MSPRRFVPGAILVALAGLSASAAQDAGPQPPAARGVYTTMQAERGRGEYTTACAHCHSSDLLGDIRLEIPSLAEDDFFVRWGGRTAADLFRMISKDMPADKPGQLTKAAYVDILAYILQVNRFQAGPAELRGDDQALQQIMLEKQR